MAGSLRQTNISGDHSGEHLAREMPTDLLGHLSGEIGSSVKHSQGYTEDLQAGIQSALHHPQGAHQITETLQCVVLALYRHQN